MPEIYYSIITHRPIADWRVPHDARYPWKEMGVSWASGYSDYSGMGGCTVFWVADDIFGEAVAGGADSPSSFRSAVSRYEQQVKTQLEKSPYRDGPLIQLIGWNNVAFDDRVMSHYGGSLNYPKFSIYQEIKHLRSRNYTKPPPSSAPWGRTAPLPPKSENESKRQPPVSKQHPWSLNGLCRTAIASLSSLDSIPSRVGAGSWMVGSNVDAATLKASGNSGTADAIGWGRTWMIRGLWKARDRIRLGDGTADLMESPKIIVAIMYLKREAGNVNAGYAIYPVRWEDIEGIPEKVAELEQPQYSDGDLGGGSGQEILDGTIAWEQIENVPDTFPANWDDISGKGEVDTLLNQISTFLERGFDWVDIGNRPEYFPTKVDEVEGLNKYVNEAIANAVGFLEQSVRNSNDDLIEATERIDSHDEKLEEIKESIDELKEQMDDVLKAINSLNIFAWQINQAKVINRLDKIEQILDPDQP